MGKVLLKRSDRRGFASFDDTPSGAILYAGQDMTYFELTGVSNPQTGDITIEYANSLYQLNSYEPVADMRDVPENITGELLLYETGGGIPIEYTEITCPIDIWEAVGTCRNLSDLNFGWSEFGLVYEGGKVTTKDYGDRTGRNQQDLVQSTLPLTFDAIIPFSGINFSQASVTLTNVEVIDVAYGNNVTCGNCGVPNNGMRWQYALVESETGYFYDGYPNVLYNTNYGSGAWSNSGITVANAGEDPVALAVFGRYLIVVSRTGGGASTGALYYSQLSDYGIPGSWSKVTTGFEASKQPNAITIVGNTMFISGDNGTVYKTTNFQAGVTLVHDGGSTTKNLLRIKGISGIVVAVGADGAMIKSLDNGVSWSAVTTGIATGTNITAIDVLSPYRYWIGTGSGTDAGKLYNTIDAGTSFTQVTFTGSGTGTIKDIKFASRTIGFFLYNSTTPTGTIFSTITKGQTWVNSAPRILNLPSLYNANRIALAPNAHVSLRANNLLIAGLTTSANGALIRGIAPTTIQN